MEVQLCARPPHAGQPPCEDFNPIENAFAKLKALLRKAGERSVEGPCHLIAKLIDAFSPQECANYFAAAGYDLLASQFGWRGG